MKILITGGCGFIGCNTAAKYMKEGHKVTVLDNLSRKGSEKNLEWLRTQGDFKFVKLDLSMMFPAGMYSHFDIIFHFAAQVAVTKSIINPMYDFLVNASGTLLLLDAIQRSSQNPIFIYSSTNKVYGSLAGLKVTEEEKRYKFTYFEKGIPGDQPLDFHSPYGCSKGCADQYIRDFARIYGMKTVVLRQSCIYGPHQFGIEDQGWIAHFIMKHLAGETITIFGDGKQVRDVLHIDDLLVYFDRIIENIETARGQIYNIGGGFLNQISVLECLDYISELSGKKVKYDFSGWRQGDQRVYVSDITKAYADLNYYPRISPKEGIKDLYKWILNYGGINDGTK
jgi:CDP-paratose 2-epimerase